MTIDKLYIESDLIDNFSYFLEWSTTKSTRRFEIDNKSYLTLSVSELQKYFDTAPIKILIEHSKKILRKYYKIWWFDFDYFSLIYFYVWFWVVNLIVISYYCINDFCLIDNFL